MCKRRKPQPERATAAIYRDPHDKKYIQLSFPCNDGMFNGADPFLILYNLGNADTKALVPAMFAKCPKVISSPDGSKLELQFYLHDSTDPIEYVIKYMSKSTIPLKTDNDIMKLVVERLKQEDTFTKKHIYSMYAQSAIQNCVCLYNAQHVNIGLPQILRNTKCKTVNCLGRKTIKKNSNGQPSGGTEQLFNVNAIQKFDNRKNYTEKSLKSLSRDGHDVRVLNDELSLRTFYDKFSVTLEKDGKCTIKPRRKIILDIYQAIRMVPHTTMGHANPAGKNFHVFCKKMCLWSSPYDNIQLQVKNTIPNDKEQEKHYWVQQFLQRFPDGKGLETAFLSYWRHYNRGVTSDSDSEEDDDMFTTTIKEPRSKKGAEHNTTPAPNAKKVQDQFYQHPSDKLFAPSTKNDFIEPTVEDADMTTMEEMSTDFIQLSTVEEDCRRWAGNDLNLDSPRLVKSIEATYQKMLETKGKAAKAIPLHPELTTKQKLVKDIILDFVDKKINGVPVEPLRLFVIGIPGAGKTFAFQVVATEMIITLGDKWREYVRLACPTGSVAYHMGFGAQTIHSTFFIEVGHLGESLEGQLDKMIKLIQKNPQKTFLIIFDECSMVGRALFGAVIARLREAKIDLDNIGFIFFGDPAQCEPVADKSLWSTQPPKGDLKKTGHRMSVDGLNDFRQIMRMAPLEEIPHYKERVELMKKLKKNKKLNDSEMQQKKVYDEEFGRAVYNGNFTGVFLDEVKRTDGSNESLQFINLNTKVRYGKYKQKHIQKLKEMTATEEMTYAPEWKNCTLLTAYHFHSEDNPNRTNADSSNAKHLIEHAKRTNEPIMVFKALHTPLSDAPTLEKLPSKEFQNLPGNLYMIPDAPLILTTNINPTVILYNGARGTFIGPLYLPKKYTITSFNLFNNAAVDSKNYKTTMQVEIKTDSGATVNLPVGTALTEINGKDFDKQFLLNLNESSFASATFILPRRPPFLPDYLVIEFEEYSESGGPPFFPNVDHMKNYVCIKLYKRNKDTKKQNEKRAPRTRESFPLELAYVMTAFKGIGATHERTEARLLGMFDKPGLFLVATTRVKNPKHLYIKEWPTESELRKQRLQNSVLESENFERMVRAKSAQQMRKSQYYNDLKNIPIGISKDTVNFVADIVHNLWMSKGNTVEDKNVEEEIKFEVLARSASLGLNDNQYQHIITFMKHTDEKLLCKKIPYLKIHQGHKEKKSNKPLPSKKQRIQNSYSKVSIVTNSSSEVPHSEKRPFKKVHKPEKQVQFSNDKIMQVSRPLHPIGFQNIGSTCYINVSLQMLLSLDLHLQVPQTSQTNVLVHCPDANDKNNLHVASEFSKLAAQPTGSIKRPEKFVLSLRKAGDLQPNIEDDAMVAMAPLIDNPYLFEPSCFQLKTKSTITCNFCGKTSTKCEGKSHLILTVPNHNDNLQNIIDSYSQTVQLHDDNQYHCESEQCNTKRNAEKRDVFVYPFPQVLIVYLSRFSLPNNAKNINKIDLRDHSIKIKSYEDENAHFESYRLHAAISHIGDTIHSGHYIAFVNKENIWYCCNDDLIEPCELISIRQDEVVILAFKKQSETPLTQQSTIQITNKPEEASSHLPLHTDKPCSSKSCNDVIAIKHIPEWQTFYNTNRATIEKMTVNHCEIVNTDLNCKVSLWQGDITKLALDCIVNAANKTLLGGSGVDGAIHKAAGDHLKEACKQYAPCKIGNAVKTPGFKLYSSHVIHTVGPQDKNESKLRECYENSLKIVFDEDNLRSIAFPCISTGVYGYPNEGAAHVALSVTRKWLQKNSSHVDRIIFCTYDDIDFQIYKKFMANIYFPSL